MSTAYATYGKPISMVVLLAALPQLGMRTVPCENESDTHKCLELPNGHCLHVYTENGSDVSFERFGRNDPQEALAAIAKHFKTELVDDQDDRFSEGFEDEDGEPLL